MAIVHDFYLFSAQALVQDTDHYLRVLEHEGYNAFRQSFLDLFDTSIIVPKLASEYGGWDKKSLEIQFPSDHLQDVTSWLVLLIYSHITNTIPLVSLLNSEWSTTQPLLNRQSIAELFKNNFPDVPLDWNAVQPQSTGGRIQWLPNQDALKLVTWFEAAEDKSSVLTSNQNVLYMAKETGLDLCIITSG